MNRNALSFVLVVAAAAIFCTAAFGDWTTGAEQKDASSGKIADAPLKAVSRKGWFERSTTSGETDPHRIIARLRAELEMKEVALAHAELDLRATDPELQFSPEERLTRHATEVLEERLVRSASDGPEAQRERRRLEAVVRQIAPTANVDVFCSDAMCRVMFLSSDGADGTDPETTERIVDDLGKSYPATQIIRDERGETSVYLAQSPEELAVDPLTEQEYQKIPKIVREIPEGQAQRAPEASTKATPSEVPTSGKASH